MPKNKVSDPITDQEMAFARQVLSGAMTDRQAAEAVGLNPDSAAYTKSKPHVRAYMLEHRAAVQQQIVQQVAEGLHRLNLDREQVLNRLWEIANLSPDMTRNSITGQVKALSMIIAMENFIPDRRAVDRLAVSSEKNPAPGPTPEIYASVGRAKQQARTIDPQPTPAPTHEEDQQEDSPSRPASPRSMALSVPGGVPQPAPGSVGDPPLGPGRSHSTFANCFIPSEVPELYIPPFASVPDLRVPFSIKKNPFNPFVRPR
jgi:hypothetical protein